MLMIFGALIMVPSGANALDAGWTAVRVYDKPDPFNSFGSVDNSIALDSHGHVHIAFSFATTNNDNVLMYVTNASGSWASQVVDSTTDSGYYASIAIDQNDHVHIAHYSYNERGLRYATNAGGSWTNESVITRIDIEDGFYRADAQDGLTIDVDLIGIPHIAYTNQTSPGTYEGRHFDLMMATKAGGIWSFETVDGVTGGDLCLHKSLVIDSGGHSHIAYSLGSKLHYATDASGSWATQTIDDDDENGREHYITLDRQGHVGISYITNFTSPPSKLKYATNASGSWVIEKIAETISIPTALGYNPSGQPCVMSFSSSKVALYTRTASDTWTKTNPLGSSTVITIHLFMMTDDLGKFHVSYVEYGNLWYATNSIPLDVDAPSIEITSPSSSGSYATDSNVVAVSGTATDDVGVTSVTWANDRGGSGTASGTLSWSIGSVSLQSGDNIITVTAHDGSGKTAADSITVTYTPDTTDPTVTITSPTSDVSYTTTVDHIAAGDLAGTASDDKGVTSVSCLNSANAESASVSGTTAWATSTDLPLVLGDNQIVVTATDANGNSGTDTITVTYAVDNTDPTVAITSPSEGFATNAVSVTVNWQGNDNVGVVGYQYRLDAGAWSAMGGATSHTFSGLSQGGHTVDVKAYDARDNNATATVHFTVDLTSPTLSIASPAEGAMVSSTSIGWSGSDALSGIDHYQVRVDGGSWSAPLQTTSYAFTNLADGPHQAQIRAFDQAGNYVDRFVNFTLDTTAPVLAITDMSIGNITNQTNVTVAWGASDAISGLAGYQYRIDGGNWSAWSSTTSYEFEGLSDGEHNVTIRARDALGNIATVYIEFLVDTLGPTLSVENPATGAHLNSGSVTISWSANDTLSGILGYRSRLDGGEWSERSTAAEVTFTGLSDGAHTVEIEAFDNANNSVTRSITFNVDTAIPEVSITSPTGNATYSTSSSSMSLSGALSDNIGVVEVSWANSRGGSGTAVFSNTTWSISDITLLEGSNTITITARDASNNTAATSLTVTYALPEGDDEGSNTMTIAIVLLLIVALIAVALFLVRRRMK